MRITPQQFAPITDWEKPERSGAAGHCVEVGHLPDGTVVVRNSNYPAEGGIGFTPAEWTAFVGSVRDGQY